MNATSKCLLLQGILVLALAGLKGNLVRNYFKSRTVPATVSYKASCDTSSHCPDFWMGRHT